MTKQKKTLVLGIGNVLMTDEGVGVHVVEYLRDREGDRSDLTLVDGGTLSFTLAPLLEEHERFIVVDAAVTGGSPGHVACYEGEEMDRYLKGNRRSVHEVGLGDMLDIAILSGAYPEKRALVGIEPESMEWGESPSPDVQKGVSVAAERVLELVERWNE